MTVYVIDRKRFLVEYEYNAKRKSKAVFNWFIKDSKVIFLLDYENVTYMYAENQEVVKADPLLMLTLDSSMSILGVVHVDDVFEDVPEDVELEEEILDEQLGMEE